MERWPAMLTVHQLQSSSIKYGRSKQSDSGAPREMRSSSVQVYLSWRLLLDS